MRNYCTQATYGDTYTQVCKLASLPPTESIHCIHSVVRPLDYGPKLLEIYSVLPNVTVDFVESGITQDYPVLNPYPKGAERTDDQTTPPPLDPPEIGMVWFPSFEFANVEKFSLPKRYQVLSPVAGGMRKSGNIWRTIPAVSLRFEEDMPTVVLGIEQHPALPENVIDLTGQTSIKEAQQIVKNASRFTGMQGLLLFVALSMKVDSTAYIFDKHEDIVRRARIIGPWKEYCKEYVIVRR